MSAIPALINVHQKNWELMGLGAELFETASNQHTTLLRELSKNNIETLRDEAEQIKSRERWATVATVAQYIAAGASIAMGAIMGGRGGNCLVASGAIGLATRAAHDTGLTERLLPQKLVQHVEMAALFLQMSLGLAGGILSWQAGALAAQGTALATLKKAASALNVASGVSNTASHIGMKVYEQKIADLQAKMREIALHTTYHQLTRTQLATDQTQQLHQLLSESQKLNATIQQATLSQ